MTLLPTLSLRQLLLIDGMGAVLSAGLLAGLVAQHPDWFGMPPVVVYVMAGVAAVFAGYSWYTLLKVHPKSPHHVGIIAIANAVYAWATLSLLVLYRQELELLGWAYFLGEVGVLLLLIRMEWQGMKAVA